MSKKTLIIIAVIVVLIIAAILVKNVVPGPVDVPSSTNNVLIVSSADDLKDLISTIYSSSKVEDELPMLETNEIDLTNPDMVKSFTGLDDTSKIECAVVSEPLMSSSAYSFVLIKVKDTTDADSIAKAVSENVDTRKWICVQAEQLYTVSSGNVVCLVMTEKAIADKVLDAFKAEANSIGQVYEVVHSMDDIELPPEMF